MKQYKVTVFEQIINDYGYIQEKMTTLVMNERKLEWYKENDGSTSCGEYFSIKSIQPIEDSTLYDVTVNGKVYIGIHKYQLEKLTLNNVRYTIIEEYEKPTISDYYSTENKHSL